MTTSVLQDSMASPPSSQGPRFRPYASPNHQVTKGRYITSNDPRGYIPVYEYPLNGQWIMMDIDDGYILWTGIWKALGNSKADIVKMLDSQPDLAPLIRRVRGGYLKIQGTWMPYEVALRLSRRVAWPIRDDLVPLFGPTFPSTCLSPDQPGYGQVVSNGTGRRRARRNTQPVAPIASAAAREHRTSWTVVTGAPGANSSATHYGQQVGPLYPAPQMYPPPDLHLYSRAHPPTTWRHPSAHSPSTVSLPPSSAVSSSPTYREHNRSRYSPYPHSSSAHRKRSASSCESPSVDIPAMSFHDRRSDVEQRGRMPEPITLPPILSGSQSRSNFTEPPYALPPISTLEHSRGGHPNNSAEVLRRLRMDDELNSDDERHNEEQRARARSLSASMYKSSHPSSSASWPSLPAAPLSRSHHDRPSHLHSDRSGSRTASSLFPLRDLNHDAPSSSYDDNSTCDPSPVSPATPHDRPGLVPLSILKEQSRMAVHTSSSFPGAPLSFSRDWPSDQRGASRKPEIVHEPRMTDARLSACRHSCEDDDSDKDSTHPLRPW